MNYSENISSFGNSSTDGHSKSKNNSNKPLESFETLFESKIDNEKPAKEQPEKPSINEDCAEKPKIEQEKIFREFLEAAPMTLSFKNPTHCVETLFLEIKQQLPTLQEGKDLHFKTHFGQDFGSIAIQISSQKNGFFSVMLKPSAVLFQNVGAHLAELEKKLKEKYKIESFEVLTDESFI